MNRQQALKVLLGGMVLPTISLGEKREWTSAPYVVEAHLLTQGERDRWWAYLNQNGLYRRVLRMEIWPAPPLWYLARCTSLHYTDPLKQEEAYRNHDGTFATTEWLATLKGPLPA